LVNGEEVKLETDHVAKLLAYEKKILNLFIQGLFDNQFTSVKKKTTTKGIWEAFQKQHVDKGLANKIFFMCNFFMSQMDSLKMMEQHLNKLGAMVNEI
jgi:hypothetical protein